MFQRFLYVILISFLSLQIHSTEIDSFTDRDPLMKDALLPLNNLMAGYFADAIKDANKKNSCKSHVISDALINRVRGMFWNKIEIDIEQDVNFSDYPNLDSRRSDIDDSVYSGTKFIDGPGLRMAKLGFLMRFGDDYIGSDKFGHFIQQGYYYFEHLYKKNNTLMDAFAYGEMTERTYYGLETTGIYSYGDLAANYDGLSFWERVNNINLASGVKPHFTCQNNIWKQTASFNWADYITPAWDEGTNCSRFKSHDMNFGIQTRIKKLEKKRFTRLTCPINPSKCKKIIEHYGNIASRIITPLCF
jgi:hypothetical protein